MGIHIIYTLYISAIIFPISVSWTWGGGWLSKIGFVDFMGAGVVHMASAVAGLVATVMLNPRLEINNNLARL